MLPIALQLYSLREDAEKDLKGTLARVKAMGYDGVELAGLYGHSPAEVKKLLTEAGLQAISAHVPYALMMEDPEGVLGGYKEIGCQYVAIPHMTAEYQLDGAKGKEALENMRMLAETAKKLGLVMLYHNHDFEFKKVGGKYALDVIYESIPADLLQTEIDTCWVSTVGINAPAYLRQYTGRAPVVHLKDFVMADDALSGDYDWVGIPTIEKIKSGKFEFRPVGHGQQDMPAILKAAGDVGAKWVVVEQDQPSMGKTPVECAEMSLAYLKSL
jgi:sugar phosphate isomerase/epimerase